jgi:hypothetical protein
MLLKNHNQELLSGTARWFRRKTNGGDGESRRARGSTSWPLADWMIHFAVAGAQRWLT